MGFLCGVTNKVQYTSMGSIGGSGYSYCFWVNISNQTNSNNENLTRGYNSSSQLALFLSLSQNTPNNASSTYHFTVTTWQSDGTTKNREQSSFSISQGVWHCIEVVNGSAFNDLRVWIDGVEYTGWSTSSNATNGTTPRTLDRLDVGETFNFGLDCVLAEVMVVTGTYGSTDKAAYEGLTLNPRYYTSTVAFYRSLISSGTMGFGTGTFTADGGSYNISNHPAMPGYVLAAAAASTTLAGQSATLKRALQLPASPATPQLQGQSAALQRGLRLAAVATSATLTGQDVALKAARYVYADPGVVLASGQAAALVRALRLTAEPAAFDIEGQDGALRAGRVLLAEPAQASAIGQSAALTATRVLAASPALLVLAGQSASLRYVPLVLFTVLNGTVRHAYALNGRVEPAYELNGRIT
jgi:hypothetical protein